MREYVKKVYVCSPYTKAKRNGGDGAVRHLALSCMLEAASVYGNDRIELFSPVLTNMYQCEKMSHDEAMTVCFAQLKSCDEVFIGKKHSEFIKNSKGIMMEYEYATLNNIPVKFMDTKMKIYFKEANNAKA